MAMVKVALRLCVHLALRVVSGHGALDGAGADAQSPAGRQAGQDATADCRGQLDIGAGKDAGGEDGLAAEGFRAMEKLARSGSAPGTVMAASAIAVRSAW